MRIEMTTEAFRKESIRALEMMHEGDLESAGFLYESLYASLRMNSYRVRLTKKRFDKVFFGLTPGDVLSMLFNKVAYHLNACETKQVLKTKNVYKRIEEDFHINGAPDYDANSALNVPSGAFSNVPSVTDSNVPLQMWLL